MKLIDMKRKAKEVNKVSEVPMSTRGSYPYGLKISLEKEDLKKLNLKLSDFNIGDTIDIISNATVTSMRSSESDGYNSSNLEFELRKISLKAKE